MLLVPLAISRVLLGGPWSFLAAAEYSYAIPTFPVEVLGVRVSPWCLLGACGCLLVFVLLAFLGAPRCLLGGSG